MGFTIVNAGAVAGKVKAIVGRQLLRPPLGPGTPTLGDTAR